MGWHVLVLPLPCRSLDVVWSCSQNAAIASTAVFGGGFAYYKTTDVQKQFELASSSGPLIRLLDAETAHKAGIWAAKLGLFPKETRPDPESLNINVWGKSFSNPIGAACSVVLPTALVLPHIWPLSRRSTSTPLHDSVLMFPCQRKLIVAQ